MDQNKASGRGKLMELIKSKAPELVSDIKSELTVEDDNELSVSNTSISSEPNNDKPMKTGSHGRGSLLKLASLLEKNKEKIGLGSVLDISSQSNKPGKGRGIVLAPLLKQLTSESSETHSLSPSKDSPTSLSESVTSKIKQISLEDKNPPCVKRGESGEQINVYTNYVSLTLDPGKGVFLYDVKFMPEVLHATFRYELINGYFNTFKGIRCYDGGKQLYMPEKLQDKFTIEAKHPVDETPVNIVVTFVVKKKLRECTFLYNVLFNNCSKILNMTKIGRQHFDHRFSRKVPQHKLEIWPGYVTSVEEFEGGIHLLCDIRHRVLRTETAYNILVNIAKCDSVNFKTLSAKELLGQCVLTRYNNHTYRIDDIDWDRTPMSTFELSSGEKITFLEYYRRQYGINILDIKQPLLINKQKANKKNGSDQLICLVPELCNMTGLTDHMRKDMLMMKDIATYTIVTPAQRQLGFKKFLENIKNSSEAQQILKNWGLHVSEEPLQLDARILSKENLIFKNQQKVIAPLNVEWSKYLQKLGVLRSVDINSWILVFTKRSTSLANSFKTMLKKIGPGLGIEINEPVKVSLKDDKIDSYIRGIKAAINSNTQIVVCLCPTSRDDRYSAIKKLCCQEIPVPSQVVNCGTIERENRMRSVVQNVAIQMNNKLGGASWGIHIPLKNCMVCGIDSFHNASRKGCSVGAFVATMNSEHSQWFSRTCMQEPGQEVLDGLVYCFTSALKKYHSINKTLPDLIVVFRDGVGDSQLKFIQKYEVEQFIEACNLFSANYKPRFCFIIVQKRINTKFYLELNDSLQNPPPGSVLDHTITRRNYYDFFLVSQFVSRGTITPTHYIVLYDTSGLKPDHVQRLTYKFCHLYYNWIGAIRIPAPCHYAHKLAFMVGKNIKGLPSDLLEDKLYYL